jgi:hypothetical protein
MATPKASRATRGWGGIPSPTSENWELRQAVEASQLSEFEEVERALAHEQLEAAVKTTEGSSHVRLTHRQSRLRRPLRHSDAANGNRRGAAPPRVQCARRCQRCAWDARSHRSWQLGAVAPPGRTLMTRED